MSSCAFPHPLVAREGIVGMVRPGSPGKRACGSENQLGHQGIIFYHQSACWLSGGAPWPACKCRYRAMGHKESESLPAWLCRFARARSNSERCLGRPAAAGNVREPQETLEDCAAGAVCAASNDGTYEIRL